MNDESLIFCQSKINEISQIMAAILKIHHCGSSQVFSVGTSGLLVTYNMGIDIKIVSLCALEVKLCRKM